MYFYFLFVIAIGVGGGGPVFALRAKNGGEPSALPTA